MLFLRLVHICLYMYMCVCLPNRMCARALNVYFAAYLKYLVRSIIENVYL